MDTVDFKFCTRCGRRLKGEKSKKIGMGKICFEKSLGTMKGQISFDEILRQIDIKGVVRREKN